MPPPHSAFFVVPFALALRPAFPPASFAAPTNPPLPSAGGPLGFLITSVRESGVLGDASLVGFADFGWDWLRFDLRCDEVDEGSRERLESEVVRVGE